MREFDADKVREMLKAVEMTAAPLREIARTLVYQMVVSREEADEDLDPFVEIAKGRVAEIVKLAGELAEAVKDDGCA